MSRRPIKAICWALTVAAAALLVLGLVLTGVRETPAQPKLPESKTPESRHAAPESPRKPAATPPAAPQQMAVSIEQALYLIRSTLLTLNDANRSGNYTVLRDLASPDFQGHNTAADLAQTFSDLRRRSFDLYAAALLAPQLTAVPAINEQGMLRLTGHIPTRPLQINFDLLFQAVATQWRLYGIAIATPEAPPVQAPQAQAQPPERPAGKKQ